MADYTKGILAKKTVKELQAIITDELESDPPQGAGKGELVQAVLDIQARKASEEEAELEDEVELDDEESDIEPELDEEELDEEIEADEVDEPAEEAPKKSRAKKTKADGDNNTIAAKQVATMLGTEAKTLRQFFRSEASTVKAVGSGGRYEFNEADVPKIKEEFEAWKQGHASRGSKRTGEAGATKSRSKRGPKVAEVTEVEEVEELEIEELEDAELDDEDLELEDED